ncbi:MAG: DUF2147 domain-containing protein [Myxococcota bacterium]
MSPAVRRIGRRLFERLGAPVEKPFRGTALAPQSFMMKRLLLLLVSVVAVAVPVAAAPSPEAGAILGTYWNPEKTGKIEIYEKGGRYFGRVLSLDTPVLDEKNPDPALRQRPVVGMTFLSELRFDGKDRWKGGKLYIYRKGKTVDAEVWLDDGHLAARGYAGLWVLGRTVRMKRVSSVE